ncbi:MAG: tRNA pseudouridine(38-40) synthase TruA [Clostridiales bacterium]|nr:tRNA pseudouridine(38-40) synthase TruA [Clostridiales bacterium]
MNIRLDLQYDGTAYHGWQIQKNALSVQENIKNAIFKITGEEVNLTGCGRTDAGVHAINYTANFKTNSNIPPEKFAPAINSKLPKDIRILKSLEVCEDFNAKNSAKGKTYIYKILNSKSENAFLRNYSWHYPIPLDTEKMQRAAAAFLGEHDFLGFSSSGRSTKTTIRTIYALDIEKSGDIITISVTGNGFLYNMVRIIAGTLAFCGHDKINAADMEDIILSKTRSRAGITAPAQGLFLREVYY